MKSVICCSPEIELNQQEKSTSLRLQFGKSSGVFSVSPPAALCCTDPELIQHRKPQSCPRQASKPLCKYYCIIANKVSACLVIFLLTFSANHSKNQCVCSLNHFIPRFMSSVVVHYFYWALLLCFLRTCIPNCLAWIHPGFYLNLDKTKAFCSYCTYRKGGKGNQNFKRSCTHDLAFLKIQRSPHKRNPCKVDQPNIQITFTNRNWTHFAFIQNQQKIWYNIIHILNHTLHCIQNVGAAKDLK